MSAALPNAYAADALVDQGKSLGDYLGILRRRLRLIVAVSTVVFVIAAVVAATLPAVYRSTATILIKEQEIPQEFVRSTVTSFADERIQVISQQVMTRATLLDLVDRYGLYGKDRQRETSEEILDRMRRDIKLTLIGAENANRTGGKSTIAFSLSYDSEVAANAQKIANELVTLYLNENVKNRQRKAAETTSFLDEELVRATQEVADLEQRLAGFKLRNQGRLPDSGTSVYASERLASEIQGMDRDIVFFEERKQQLESQLADTKPSAPVAGGAILEPEDRLKVLQLQLTGVKGTLSEDHPDVKRMRREIAALKVETGLIGDATDREAKLLELKAQLSVLRQKYSDEHPDVVKLKRAAAAIEEAVRSGEGADGKSDNVRPARKPDNPAYKLLQAQIETTESQLQSMRAEREELRARLRLADLRVGVAPEVEREYLEVTRDLDTSRARFRELRLKQMQAQMAEQLERDRKAERFTLIEPPVFPEKPYRPNRSLILLMGLVLALGGGVGAAALRETLDQTVHGARDVVRTLQVPVLAVLPRTPSPVLVERRAKRVKLMVIGGVLAIVCMVAAVHWLYMPLDVAWYRILRRLGA
jgi:polysaccharide biosynthesis transport protein